MRNDHQIPSFMVRAFLALVLLAGLRPAPAAAWNWTHAGVDSSSGIPGQFISMKVDLTGRLHGSYYRFDNLSDGNRNLKYTTNLSPNGDGPWQTVTVDGSASNGSYSSLALTSNNVPHIAYYDSEFANLRHAWYDSLAGSWRKETVDSPGTVGQFSAMGVDTVSNTLYIAYFDASTPGLKVARKAPGGLWTFEFPDVDGVVGLYNSIAVNGTVQIAYYDLTKRNLKFAEQTGPQQWTVTTVDSIGDVGRYTSIGGDFSNTWITYYDVTNGRLKFAERDNLGHWTLIPLDESADVGAGTALSAGPGRRPAVVYYDSTHQDLKYAERINGTWLYSTIATGGNVGRYAGLATGWNDLPNTLYFDETQGKLRFAHGYGETTGAPEPPDPAGPLPPRITVTANPARVPVIIDLESRSAGPFALRVFDVRGRLVREIFDGPIEEGSRRFRWDGEDASGRTAPSGVYFASGIAAGTGAAVRFVLVR